MVYPVKKAADFPGPRLKPRQPWQAGTAGQGSGGAGSRRSFKGFRWWLKQPSKTPLYGVYSRLSESAAAIEALEDRGGTEGLACGLLIGSTHSLNLLKVLLGMALVDRRAAAAVGTVDSDPSAVFIFRAGLVRFFDGQQDREANWL